VQEPLPRFLSPGPHTTLLCLQSQSHDPQQGIIIIERDSGASDLNYFGCPDMLPNLTGLKDSEYGVKSKFTGGG